MAANDKQNPDTSYGMLLSPEQQRRRRIDADMQRASENIRQSKAAIGNAVSQAARSIVGAGQLVKDTVTNVRFDDSLPDYTNYGLERRRAENFVKNNPVAAQNARQAMGDMAGRAVGAAKQAVNSATLPHAPTDAGNAEEPVPLTAPSAPARSDAGPQDVAAQPEASQSGAQPKGSGEGGVGNGIGGLSVGEEGDSRMALDRFERANQIREQMRLDERKGEIGANGGLYIANNGSDAMERARERREMKIAQDSGLMPSLIAGSQDARLRQAELDQRSEYGLRQNELAEQRMAMDAAQTETDFGLRMRELENAEQTGELERQRMGTEIEAAEQEMKHQRRIEALREQLSDPNLDPETRERLQQAYSAMTTPAKDRYMLQDVVMGHDSMGAPIFGKQVIDTVTGRPISQDGQKARRTKVPLSEVKESAKRRGLTPDQLTQMLQAQGVSVYED